MMLVWSLNSAANLQCLCSALFLVVNYFVLTRHYYILYSLATEYVLCYSVSVHSTTSY